MAKRFFSMSFERTPDPVFEDTRHIIRGKLWWG